jgi:hypothetical protein
LIWKVNILESQFLIGLGRLGQYPVIDSTIKKMAKQSPTGIRTAAGTTLEGARDKLPTMRKTPTSARMIIRATLSRKQKTKTNTTISLVRREITSHHRINSHIKL